LVSKVNKRSLIDWQANIMHGRWKKEDTIGRTLHEGVPRTPVCAGTVNFAEGEIFLRHCHTFASFLKLKNV